MHGAGMVLSIGAEAMLPRAPFPRTTEPHAAPEHAAEERAGPEQPAQHDARLEIAAVPGALEEDGAAVHRSAAERLVLVKLALAEDENGRVGHVTR